MNKQNILTLNQRTPIVVEMLNVGRSVYISTILIAITFKYSYSNADTSLYNNYIESNYLFNRMT